MINLCSTYKCSFYTAGRNGQKLFVAYKNSNFKVHVQYMYSEPSMSILIIPIVVNYNKANEECKIASNARKQLPSSARKALTI